MTSQKEIAKKLNLSQSTVSRALNNDHSLPLATKLKVKQFALEIGYESRRYTEHRQPEPEPYAQGRNLLALVYQEPTLDGKYYSLLLEMIQGFIQASTAAGLRLIVKEVMNIESARSIITQYGNNAIGAILLLRYPDEIADFLCNGISCVSLNHHYDNLKIQTVEPQQEEAFSKLYRFMYENGHRRIGFLTVRNSYGFAISRYAGFLQAAYRLNNPVSPDWVMNIGAGEPLNLAEIGGRIARLYREEGVDGYLCTSGHFAKQLIKELARHDLRVPEDISLAAFDDILTPDEEGHLLCGMQADYQRLAEMAIRLLRNQSEYAGVASISSDADFRQGNTVRVIGAE